MFSARVRNRLLWLAVVAVAFTLSGLFFLGCGGQAESAQEEQTADAPLDSDRWCCTRNNAYNGVPYLECGLPGPSIPPDAEDCACDAYLVDCEGE